MDMNPEEARPLSAEEEEALLEELRAAWEARLAEVAHLITTPEGAYDEEETDSKS